MVLRLRARAHGTFVACSCGYCNGHLCATCRSRTPAFQPHGSGCCRANSWWKTRPFLEDMQSLTAASWLRNRLGVRFSFLEDPMVEGMLAARSSKGMAAKIKQEAIKEGKILAQKEEAGQGCQSSYWPPGRPPNAEGRPAEARCATAHRGAGESHRRADQADVSTGGRSLHVEARKELYGEFLNRSQASTTAARAHGDDSQGRAQGRRVGSWSSSSATHGITVQTSTRYWHSRTSSTKGCFLK